MKFSQSQNLKIYQLGLQPYDKVFIAMHNFIKLCNIKNVEEIWLVQHPQVFTLGSTSKIEDILIPNDIPIINSDRGGKVTYHGPGQQIVYCMINLRYRKLGIRALIRLLEKTVIATLAYFDITAHTRIDAPGVYVYDDKICSIGLRIRNGYSFHGLALNIAMDITPFLWINPCGYCGLRMIQMRDFIPYIKIDDVTPILIENLISFMNMNNISLKNYWS